MQRTITLHLPAHKSLVKTIEAVNVITNDIMALVFHAKVTNKTKLHHLTYYRTRERYPEIPSNLVCAARDTASEMLKQQRLDRLPKKRNHTAIRYDARTFACFFNRGYATLSSVEGRVKVPFVLPAYFQQYVDWEPIGATLSFDGVHLILGIIVEQTTPNVLPITSVLGVDTGINNHAVLSNNKFYDSAHIHKVKGEYQHLKSELQAKGTRSAKRKLKRIAKKEHRFMADVNHQVAKWIVNQPFDGVALENLTGIKDKKRDKAHNKRLGKWAFAQLQRFVKHNAERAGKAVLIISPMNTSQMCSRCGSVRKANREGHRYKCKACGFELHSDLNAARNIARLGIAEASRPPVNRPNVAGGEAW
ncbi:MAG: transposase [Methanomassiliicoccales archaeon]